MQNHKKRIDKYIDGILSEKIISNKYIKLMVKRHLNDLIDGYDRGLYFNEDKANKIINFFELGLRHSQGVMAGQKFILSDYQVFRLWVLFGWLRVDTGGRRFNKAYTEIGRKNGKTTEAAGIGLYCLAMDGEKGPQVYSAATSISQARLVFTEAKEMIRQSSSLQKRLKYLTNAITPKEGPGYFHCLSSDASKLDGKSTSCALIDEVHEHKNRDLIDKLVTSGGSRPQPLFYEITTAGSNRNSICYEHHEMTKKILEGSLIDDDWFGAIYSIDEDDDWHDENVWYKPNPNLGVSKSLRDMRSFYTQCVNNPSNLNTFLRLHLNVWTDSVTRWVTDDLWMKGAKEVNLEKLKGKKCWIGVDLASVSDTTALAILFEPDENGEQCVLFKCYLPESTLYTGTRAQFHNYHFWARDGFLTMTKGAKTDYKKVIADLLELKELYNVQLVGIDRWNSSNFHNELYDLGFDCVGFGQGYKSQTPAINGLEGLLLENKLIHGGNPVARWQCGNVMLDHDAADNRKMNKDKSTEKIDLMAALSTAVGISQEQVQNKIPTITII